MSLSHTSTLRQPFESWNTRPHPTYKHIRVESIAPALGAEVSGVDLRQPLPAEQVTELKQAIADHLVLVFRDQAIDRDDHKRFASLFGDALHEHKLAGDLAKEDPAYDPAILAWKTDRNSGYTAGEAWHSDVSCDRSPIWCSFLRVTRLPEVGGGDTSFANMYLAYELLSEPIKALLDNLTAVHDGAHAWTRAYRTAPKPGQTFPANEHPIVVRHPLSGRRLLYVNPGFTTHIPQLTPAESDALLAFLYRHVEQSLILQTRIRWQENTLIYWDNWATQHHAIWDYYPFERWGERISVTIDQVPQG